MRFLRKIHGARTWQGSRPVETLKGDYGGHRLSSRELFICIRLKQSGFPCPHAKSQVAKEIIIKANFKCRSEAVSSSLKQFELFPSPSMGNLNYLQIASKNQHKQAHAFTKCEPLSKTGLTSKYKSSEGTIQWSREMIPGIGSNVSFISRNNLNGGGKWHPQCHSKY